MRKLTAERRSFRDSNGDPTLPLASPRISRSANRRIQGALRGRTRPPNPSPGLKMSRLRKYEVDTARDAARTRARKIAYGESFANVARSIRFNPLRSPAPPSPSKRGSSTYAPRSLDMRRYARSEHQRVSLAGITFNEAILNLEKRCAPIQHPIESSFGSNFKES